MSVLASHPETTLGNASEAKVPLVQPLLLRFFPSFSDLAFFIPLAVLFVLSGGVRSLLSDCDTGWHIRTGDWILQHRQIPYRDLFSFSKPDQPWFAWEWGWDVLASLIHGRWGLSGLVLASALVLGSTSVLLYRLVRRHSRNDILALVVAELALFTSSVHWLARPHLVSWVFIILFLHILERAGSGQVSLLWWTPGLTLLWANLHGSFFLAPFFLFLYGGVKTAQKLLSTEASGSKNSRVYLCAGFCCLLISFANPYGWHLHEHVIQYLRDSAQLRDIVEFRPIDLASPAGLAFEVLIALGVFATASTFARGDWAQGLMLLVWSHLALKSVRNVPIFAFIAAPSIAALLSSWLEQVSSTGGARWVRTSAKGLLNFGQEFRTVERVERIPLFPLAAVAFGAVSLGVLPGGSAAVTDFDGRDFPVAATQAIARIPHARVFTFDQWGDYLIYRQFPHRVAFVDGRSDFYGAPFSKRWVDTMKGNYGWSEMLNQYSIDTVLVNTQAPLSAVLKERHDWKPVFDDGKAIVFCKRAMLDREEE
jgi:hypothetical protein